MSVGAVDVVSQALAGFAALGRDAALRALIWLIVCAGILKGVGDVVVVTFADDRLEGGGGQAGLLAGAYGLGAILGALGITRLAVDRPCQPGLPVGGGALWRSDARPGGQRSADTCAAGVRRCSASVRPWLT